MDPLRRARTFTAKNYQGEASSIWHRMPVSRRASVFVLLFLGHVGELRVVLTKRSSQLRNFPGHISLPGGKADTGLESPWMVARREMSEEIGISEHDAELLDKHGFVIDKVTELPCYLSRTFSAVKPCVGFMADRRGSSKGGSKSDSVNSNDPLSGGDETALFQELKLRVNPGESSSIFSCPLEDFLYPASKGPATEAIDRTHYQVKWGGLPWNLRSYTFPQKNPREVNWLQGHDDLSATESEGETDSASKCDAIGGGDSASSDSGSGGSGKTTGSETKSDATDSASDSATDSASDSATDSGPSHDGQPPAKKPRKSKQHLSQWGKLGSRRDSTTNEKIYDVWGLTANILHDLAEVVYLPASERNPEKHYGEEELIWSVWNHGQQMRTKERSEIESQLISSKPSDKISFGDLLPRTEFNRLKRVYSVVS